MAITIKCQNRTALAPGVIGKPMPKLQLAKLSPAKLPAAKLSMNGLAALPFLEKASFDLGLTNAYHSAVSSPLVQKASVVADEAVSLCSSHPYPALGAAVCLTVFEVLLIRSRHNSHGYQLKKAVDPKTKLNKVISLCRDSKYPDVRRIALEEHENIPENVVLERGKLDPDSKVRAEAIKHPNFPEKALLEQISNGQLAKATYEIKSAVKQRLALSILTEDLWIKLLNHSDPDIRSFFARKLLRENQKLSEGTIRALFSSQYTDVKLVIFKLEGIKIPQDVISMAMKSTDAEVKLAAFSPHLDIPADLLMEYIHNACIIKDAAVGMKVLEHPNTPSKAIAEGLFELHLMYKIAGSDSSSTIASVLKKHSPQKGPEILDLLEKKDPELAKKVKIILSTL